MQMVDVQFTGLNRES